MKILVLFIFGLFILSTFAGGKNEIGGIGTFKWLIQPIPSNVISIEGEDEVFMRYSFYFITAHYEKGFHADGIIFHFLNIYDSKEHWANLTGYIEIKFMDGEYYRDDNYSVITHWWGSPGFIYYYVTITFSRKFEYINLKLDYTENGKYIRTIDRTFYGRWGIYQDWKVSMVLLPIETFIY